MALTGNYSGNTTRPNHQLLTGAGIVTMTTGNYSISVNGLTLSAWSFYNSTAGAVACILYWFDGTTQRAIWGKSCPANDTVISADLPLRLNIGDEIRVQAANGVNCTLDFTINLPTQNIVGGQ